MNSIHERVCILDRVCIVGRGEKNVYERVILLY